MSGYSRPARAPCPGDSGDRISASANGAPSARTTAHRNKPRWYEQPPLAAISQRVDEESEGRWRLAAARIIEVVARKGQAPVLKHAPEAAPREVGFRHPFRHIA